MEAAQIVVKTAKAKLDCPLCRRPLKPPIFECDGGHLACARCRGHAQLSNNNCYACNLNGSYGRNPTLETFLRSGKTRCPNAVYGCHAMPAYCDVDDHLRECPCAPCSCTERGCPFLGLPPALRDHIAAEHDSPPVPFRYGHDVKLVVPVDQRWRALAAQEDGRLFVVARRALGVVTVVSLVCVRANAAAAPARYACRLAVELPTGDGGGGVKMEAQVGSSALTGEAPDCGVFVGARQLSLSLGVRIDVLRPAHAQIRILTRRSSRKQR